MAEMSNMMRITVTGQVVPTTELDHGIENGRYWAWPLFLLYPLAWDPFILAQLGTTPDYRDQADPLPDPGQAIHLPSHATTQEDLPLLRDVLKAGGHAVLNHPPIELLGELGSRAATGQSIVSLRERWHFPHGTHGPYIYPHTQPFLQLDPHALH